MTLHRVTGTFLKGLAVVLPVVVILFAVYWLMYTLEAMLGGLFKILFPNRFYIPGLGIITGLVLCYGVGAALTSRIAQEIYEQWEALVRNIPFIKTLYGAVQDVMELFSQRKKKKYSSVVMVTLKDSGLRFVGFVTREDAGELLCGRDGRRRVAVYFPMSYQIGGYFAMVPSDLMEPLDISLEDASRLVFTAAMSMSARDEVKEELRSEAGPIVAP